MQGRVSQYHTRGVSGEWMVEPDFAGRPATSSGAQMFLGGGGGGETHRVLRGGGGGGGSSDRLAMASDLPGHALTSPTRHGGGGGHHDGGHGAAAHPLPSPTRPRPSLEHHVSLAGLRASPNKSGIRRKELTPKKVWRSRVRWGLRIAVVALLVYFFGSTVYQLKFFVKAGLLR